MMKKRNGEEMLDYNENSFCENCKYLSITEGEQQKQFEDGNRYNEDHFCKYYHERVFHFDAHDNIFRLYKCYKENKKTIEERNDK